MVQDFNEYINGLNQYARQSGIRPGVDYIEPRLNANPESMFARNVRYNPNAGLRPGSVVMNSSNLWRPGGYRQMMMLQSPKPSVDYAQKQIDKLTKAITGVDLSGSETTKRTFVKKIDKSPQVIKNIKDTGKAIKDVAKSGAKTAPKVAGKALPFAGVGLAGYDIYRSSDIARAMEQANKNKPGTYPKEAIEYYKNKAKAIAAGSAIGGIGGGILGAGAFSVPGSAIGIGTGAGLADLIYGLANINNPYKEYKLDDNIISSLENSNKTSDANVNKDTGVPTGQLDGSGTSKANGYDLEVINDMPNDGTVGTYGPPLQIRGNGTNTMQYAPQTDIDGYTTGEATNAALKANPDYEIISEYIKRYNDLNKPYIDSLQNYYNNYQTNLDETNRIKRYFTGLAGWSNNDKWAELANDYSPLNIEAQKLNILQQLQKAKYGNVNDIQELIGNMAVAKEMGHPVEVAMANKNLLTALVNQQKANLSNATKLYGYDIGADTRRYVADKAYASNLAGRDISGRYGMQGQLLSGLAYSDPEVARQIAIQYGILPQNMQPAPGLDKQGLPQVNQGDPFK